MGRKSSTPSSLTFEELDQNDALMKQIFENVKDVPEEETPPEQTSKKNPYLQPVIHLKGLTMKSTCMVKQGMRPLR